MTTRSWRALAISALGIVALAAAACAPMPAPATESWTFRADQVTINDSQDEIGDVLGHCIAALRPTSRTRSTSASA